ncbi:uncharacterized protein V1513DRAFT_442196 [Lipomyces chichibuensis]|uniref:uncharacterized protein n=1 Tax=Lipomyces chichibuensis TaxID=1546026 RepID=UPI003343EA07
MSSIPVKQKAFVVPKTGGREVLQFEDAPIPEVSATKILVKNEYAGLNFIDSYFRSGLYPASTPYIAGGEAAGTVVAIGSSVTKFKVGDRVAWLGSGAFAEYSAVDESGSVSVIPEDIDFKTAAASLLQGLTALSLVKDAYEVKPGDWILVQAAAGGMGLLLCQLINNIGAHAIGTVSTPEKAALAKNAGAEYVINYTEDDYVKKVLELTDGLGVHAVFDGVGKATFEGSFSLVRRKGSMITFGNASGAVPPFNVARLSQKNIKLLRPMRGNYMATPEEWEFYTSELWKAIADGSLKITVYKVYPLEDYRSAAEALETRLSTGKVVLKC